MPNNSNKTNTKKQFALKLKYTEDNIFPFFHGVMIEVFENKIANILILIIFGADGELRISVSLDYHLPTDQ